MLCRVAPTQDCGPATAPPARSGPVRSDWCRLLLPAKPGAGQWRGLERGRQLRTPTTHTAAPTRTARADRPSCAGRRWRRQRPAAEPGGPSDPAPGQRAGWDARAPRRLAPSHGPVCLRRMCAPRGRPVGSFPHKLPAVAERKPVFSVKGLFGAKCVDNNPHALISCGTWSVFSCIGSICTLEHNK